MVWQHCLCKNSNVSSKRGVEIIASRSSVLVLLLWLSRIIIHVWQWTMDIPFWAFVLSSMSGCQKWMRKLLDCHEKWSTSATLRSVHNFSNKSTCLFAHCAKIMPINFKILHFFSMKIFHYNFWSQRYIRYVGIEIKLAKDIYQKCPFFDSVPITTAVCYRLSCPELC